MDITNIRNFCIIAHIDHGKSTLADRMLELTSEHKNTVDHGQMLDTMDLEQERGITIKMTPVRMQWKGKEYNLIDTPGHVDFQYEVSRSLSAVEWVILLVDASQGIQAQTLSVLYMAMEHDLTIIPVLNKVDLPAANVPKVTAELEQVIGIDPDEVIAISAKTGENVDLVLDAVMERIAPPYSQVEWETDQWESRALIFDSVFDPYKWVVAYVKVVEWSFKTGDEVVLINSESAIKLTEVGHFTPWYTKDKVLSQWQIWYILTWLKSVREAQVWDTILQMKHKWLKVKFQDLKHHILPWFSKMKPFVFAGIYPIETDQYEKLKESFEKLALNDAALSREHEHSAAMWHGFRCGFLGMLHMDIIKERLIREYDMETIFTTPTVTYIVESKSYKDSRILSGKNVLDLVETWLWVRVPGAKALIDDPSKYSNDVLAGMLEKHCKLRLVVKSGWDLPEQGMIETIREPKVDVEIVWPDEWSGNIMWLAQDYRWVLTGMEYLDGSRVVWKYLMPMGEIVVDFYDRLKSITKWYATMNYEFKKYSPDDLIRLDILINWDRVEAFAQAAHKDYAYTKWKEIVEKLKELIPKHMFTIPIQASIWSKIIARETLSAMRKDVLAKCYGWDVSRKRKLLQKQKAGKKKMKMMGKVNVPWDIFIKMATR